MFEKALPGTAYYMGEVVGWQYLPIQRARFWMEGNCVVHRFGAEFWGCGKSHDRAGAINKPPNGYDA